MRFWKYGTRWEFTPFDGIPEDQIRSIVQTNDYGFLANGVRVNGRLQSPPGFVPGVGQPARILDQNQKNCDAGIRTIGFEHTPTGYTYTVVRGLFADDDSPLSLNLPKPVIGTSSSKATIIEMLKVWFYSAHNSTQSSAMHAFLSTRPVSNGFAATIDPAVIASVTKLVHRDDTAGNMIMDQNWPVEIDLTDEAGHGVLVATDKIYLTVSSESTGDTNDVACRILYRYKTVGITEYVGIVQSQG